ncbi:uncharacterized protein LOC135682811 [Rhopilema esculentum]|uniref:uncharacterized protein LOC135682811 n=1 Tax=Rhopilema esculentum TaxID=499914 RepID=UPI0031D2201C
MHLKICSNKNGSKNGFQYKLHYGPDTAMLFEFTFAGFGRRSKLFTYISVTSKEEGIQRKDVDNMNNDQFQKARGYKYEIKPVLLQKYGHTKSRFERELQGLVCPEHLCFYLCNEQPVETWCCFCQKGGVSVDVEFRNRAFQLCVRTWKLKQ